MNVTAIIPARYASTRFPGKPLVDIAGKPMVQHVYERASQAKLVARTIVATDDERIATVVRGFGGDVVMTSPNHETGTDRLAEVAAGLDSDVIVNVQGDEPLIDPAMIDAAVRPLLDDHGTSMSTLKSPIVSRHDFFNYNVVKVVTDAQGFALYFSRSPLPHFRDLGEEVTDHLLAKHIHAYKHVGLYVYRREFLLAYTRLPQTPLEQAEKLEQLRALEHGFRIKVVETTFESIGVDVPEDLEKVAARLAKCNR